MLVFALVGALVLYLTLGAMNRYSQAVTQRSNQSVADYLSQEFQLIANGVANAQALQQIAHHAMIINPAVEVYLLDTSGKILSHALAPERVQVNQVGLEPLHRFLTGEQGLPIGGTDPSDPSRKAVFSAQEVRFNGSLEGYIYVVLNNAISGRGVFGFQFPIIRFSLFAVLGCLAFGVIAALIMFYRFSRRVQSLVTRTEQFFNSESYLSASYSQTAEGKLGKKRQLDELDQLQQSIIAMEARIDSQLGEIRQATAMRKELLANISHDLRTPLTNMLGYIETLLIKQQTLAPVEQTNYLNITQNHGVRLKQLVDDLFELTKLDDEALQTEMEPFSIAELIQDVLQDFQWQADKNGVQLTFNGTKAAAQVIADIGLIQRVLENLLDNAIRHTAKGGEVKVEWERQQESVVVRVKDSGEGIESKDIPHIFERFYHVRDAGQGELKSTGLGLAIVKRILDLHDSPITVLSQRHRGTQFEFQLFNLG